MPTAKDLYLSALGRIGLPFDDGLLGVGNPTSVLAAVNAGLAEMSVDHDWLFDYAEGELEVYPGRTAYDIPSRWLRTAFLVERTSGVELRWKQRREHMRLNAPGAPQWFDTSGDQILIAPEPSTATTLIHGYFRGYDRIDQLAAYGDGEDYEDVYAQLADVDITLPAPYDQLGVLFIAKAQCVILKDREHHGLIVEEIRTLKSTLSDNRRRQQATGRIKTRSDY